MYYSVGPQGPTPSRIGIAVSKTPNGPFIDSGKPLVTGGKDFEAIDAMVFEDPKDNRILLYCGGSAGSKLKVFELSSNLINIKRELPVATPKNFTEGPFMHLRDGVYYLSYSSGRWNDDSYRVCYSTSNSAAGPWTFQGSILETNSKHAGPGHHSIIVNPKQSKNEQRFLIIYHRWENAKLPAGMPAERSIAIEKLEHQSDGKIKPVTMTESAKKH